MTFTEIGSIQNIVAAGIATIAAVIYNFAKHRHDKDVFKSNLFFSFNERYEKIRDDLDELVSWEIETEMYQRDGQSLEEVIDEAFADPTSGTPKSFRTINKYTTLCSEQYYWYKKGSVDDEVWLSWKEAMLKWYGYSMTFRKIIEGEKEAKVAYYSKDFLSFFPEEEKKQKAKEN
jgi:hypothetical protein